jgi:hypothetical protein
LKFSRIEEAPDRTWMLDKLIKENVEFQIREFFFLDLLLEFAVNSFEF